MDAVETGSRPKNEPELIALLESINGQAAFNRRDGFEVTYAGLGTVDLSMPWRSELGQYAGFLHAGMVAGLLDTACGFAAVTKLRDRVMASHVSVNYFAPAQGVRFTARGHVVRAGRKQVFTRADLFGIDEQGMEKLVASGEALLVPMNTPM